MTEDAAIGSQQSAGGAASGAGSSGGATAPAAASGGTEQKAGAQDQGKQAAQSAGGQEPAYSLKAPDGFDAAALPKIIEIAKSYGIAPDKAQKLLDDTHASQVQAKKDLDAALAKQKSDWHAEILADKEIGGDAFKATMERAQKVIGEADAKIAPGIKQILDETGYGDHPAVVKLFAYLGRENREDTFAAGDDNKAGDGKPQTLVDILYPKPKA